MTWWSRRRRLLAVALFAIGLLAAVRRLKRWWSAYNARALQFFLARVNNVEATAALDSRLRNYAEEAVSRVSPQKLAAFPRQLDATMSGGGFKTSYSGGVALALEALGRRAAREGLRENNATTSTTTSPVVRWSGTSAGAMMALGCIHSDFTRMLVWG